MIVKISSLY